MALTNASATLTGSGTTFTAAMVGRYVQTTDDQYWYRISAFTSTTVMTLESVFEGTTATGAAYTIDEAFDLPEDMHMAPIYYALHLYYKIKGDEGKAKENLVMFLGEVEEGRRRWNTKTRSAVIRGKSLTSRFPMATPPNWPTSISS